jgi:hypothetical protein
MFIILLYIRILVSGGVGFVLVISAGVVEWLVRKLVNNSGKSLVFNQLTTCFTLGFLSALLVIQAEDTFWNKFRFVCLPIIIIAIIINSIALFKKLPKAVWIAALVIVFVSMVFPVDISLRDMPGSPRFVPLVMGYPTPDQIARAERGEVLLGGCNVSGLEPKWVLVW